MCRYNCCFLFAFLSSLLTYAQKDNSRALLKISAWQNQQAEIRKNRLKAATEDLNIPKKIILAHEWEAVLVDYINGLPYYSTTHNLQARSTTGVEYLQSEQGLNIQLLGEGITVGVWDGGLVRSTHIEFDKRVTNKQGSDFSNHATHVTGTIAASGINPAAKGMLPKAKISAYYAFDNDLGPMAFEASEGLIISNHSYGLVLGWQLDDGNWEWFGGADNVDSRFGHYSSQSKSLDDIAYNAPYYTIVRSAGNDRADEGDGTRPPDGPFDCLGPGAVAKNVVTVGAITGFNEYKGPESAVMSSFSSWGPTDDGRIKPDVVGDGVGVFSTSSSDDQSYVTLQGTSMATPNVTGSIALLQQYYRQSADTFMTSAAVKSLIIHTAREAGSSPGPDYAFGWGVVNVVDGFLVLKNRNDRDTFLIQNQLMNGEQHEYQLFSDGKSPITATIAWTDVSGMPGAMGDTGSRLVNDLDIRLIDDKGTEIKPWILNPSSPSSKATKGDNFRDNVEKIEFLNPEPRMYTLRVTHKNSLVNATQSYGLTYTGSSIKGSEDDIYWVSGVGEVNGSNWSLSSGGVINADIQIQNKTWVFDNNSLLANNDVITFNGSVAIKNLIWLNDTNGIIDLNGDTLFIDHEIIIQNSNLKIRNGVIVIKGIERKSITLNFDGSHNCTVLLSNDALVELKGSVKLSSMVIGGQVQSESQNIELNELSILEGAKLHITDCDLLINQTLSIENGEITTDKNNWVFNNAEIRVPTKVSMRTDSAQFFGNTSLTGALYFQKVNINATLVINGELEVDDFNIHPASNLIIEGAGVVTINSHLVVESSDVQRTSITGLSSTSPAILAINFRELVCTDFLDLENLRIQTQSVISVGENSAVTNVEGVTSALCENLIFADFKVTSSCANSLINIENTSLGEIDEYNWDFGNGQFFEGVNDVRDPATVFDDPGSYTIRLTIKRDDQEIQFEKEVEIVSNDIPDISIIELEKNLVASLLVSQYVWYFNGILLPEENKRTLSPKESGSYRVSYNSASSECSNRMSEPYELAIVTSTGEVFPERKNAISFFPNPVSNVLTLNNVLPDDHLTIVDVNGRIFVEKRFNHEMLDGKLNVARLPDGMFFLKLVRKSSVYIYKIIKN